ncbi:Uncharacterised protein [Mycobacteroides abscessus subsp. massiliense]|uniref:hypothetical protein n=1 Tax=Mycobacteroides abscessus TaxID=36809 RepID=UPI0009A6E721|nr:hypothetical protein [Mycobacteroides abscessus]SKE69352.1 Uncharacterised protein [Mycobacteroides abscessus subsp. massiliense]SKH81435.1 Uncharacterised protein [Mycobacteroides abscessus subsp. massiliense]SKI34673.1 Uncharacterised protein [Mycobacteroides abscessus subsp. massiliense]SKJ35563.1 Uncharacterised protein [Mycobacteroides abscessus subsp. massiliense]SKK24219.1 Uncharacterised protein [Mycobacteroides abscessus subsp. massiliense]
MSDSDVVRIEPRGGTVLRIEHKSGLIHDTDFGYLLRDNPPDSVFASFTAETIQAAELVNGTVAWHRREGLVDLAAHVIEEHAEVGECVGSCGWEPADTVVIRSASENEEEQ